MDDRCALAVDLGTTGLKVGVVSFDGDVVWSDHVACETIVVDGKGREQDAELWWQTILKMFREAMASGVVQPEQIAVVACTGQWASTVPVDTEGNPVSRCIIWTDTRGGKYVRERIGGPVAGYSPKALAKWIRRNGGVPAINGKGPTGQQLFLARERPDIAAAARWYLEPVDYLTMRFTGIASGTQASMQGSWLIDTRNLDVLDYDAELVRMAGIDVSKLPPLRRTSSVVGPMRDDVADDLGIPHGVPVVTGLPDIHTAPAGSGAVLPGEAHLVISTTSWISCPAPKKKTQVTKEITTLTGPKHGTYIVANNIDTAGACFDWMRRVISLDGTATGDPIEADTLLDLAETVPAGSNGVVFTPWLNGAQAPIADGSARGGFHNISLATGAADLVRAVLEGVAVQNAMLLSAVEPFVGHRLDPIRIIGGGARSDLWCQMHADAMDRALERPADPLNAGIRGAALNGAISIGALTPQDVHDRVRVDTTFRPNPAHRALYDGLAKGLRHLHRGQKRPLAKLNRLARKN